MAGPIAIAPSIDPPVDDALIDARAKQPRAFHFAVTWATLFAHLDVVESNGPHRSQETPTTALALIPSTVPSRSAPEPLQDESAAAWEMVVPKMIRTADRTFVKLENTEGA